MASTIDTITLSWGNYYNASENGGTVTITTANLDGSNVFITLDGNNSEPATIIDGSAVISITDGSFSGLTNGDTYTINAIIVDNTDISNSASFVYDVTAPVLANVTPIGITNDTTPSYIFSSTTEGTITSNLTFTSTTSAVSGNNTITFDTLAEDTYSDKTITVTDAAGNASTLNIPEFTIDTTAPVITVTGDASITIEKGATYNDQGATSDGGETVTTSGSVDINTVGRYTLTYSATDAAGNTGTATRTVDVEDTTAPQVASFTISDSALKIGETATVTLVFTEAVSGFNSNDDITAANGTLSQMTTSDNITWTGTFNPSDDIENTNNAIALSNTYTDVAGNTGVTASISVSIDTKRPEVSIAISDTALKVNDTATLTIVFTEAVTGFSVNNISAPNGALSNFTTLDASNYSVVFTPSENVESNNNVFVIDRNYTDLAGNIPASSYTSANFTIDTKRPEVLSFTISDTALNIGESATVTLTFSESVENFDSVTDISVNHGSLSQMTSSNNITWTGTYTTPSDIEVNSTILTLKTTYTDLAGNSPIGVTNSNSFSIDTLRPIIDDISINDLSWKSILNSVENQIDASVNITTSGVEDGRTLTLSLNKWNQLGSNMDASGESISVSSDGKIVAIGSSNVKVFAYNGSWSQRGNDISGSKVSLSSDGFKLAIGDPSDASGSVTVYEYNGTSYVQLGSKINGANSGDNFGSSLSLSSDGTILSIGAPTNGTGYAKVYNLLGENWIQLGNDNDLSGVNIGDNFGYAISTSFDGSFVAIGAPNSTVNSTNSGQVKVFNYNGNNWIQVGPNINGVAGSNSGSSVSLSYDGKILAIGSPNSTNGHVDVYSYSGSSWVQQGSSINGKSSGEQSGSSVSLSLHGKVLAIGAPNSGKSRIYEFDGSNSWFQLGDDISGSSQSVSLSSNGNFIAIGETSNTSVHEIKKFSSTVNSNSTTITILASALQTLIHSESYNLTANVSDNAGNAAYSKTSPYFDVEIVPPVINDISTNDFSWGERLNVNETKRDATVNVTTSGVEDGQILTLTLNGTDCSNAVVNNETIIAIPFSVLAGLSDATNYDIVANVQDAAGNPASKTSENFLVDVTLPIIHPINTNHLSWGERLNIVEYSQEAYVDISFTGVEDNQTMTLSISKWNQIGSDISNSNGNDNFGQSVSLSSDGNTVAVGAPNVDNVGNVIVYEISGSVWIQKGGDISSNTTNDASLSLLFGQTVSMDSSGNRVAIGAPNMENAAGKVRVYEYSGNAWNQLGGDINGGSAGELSGIAIDMNSDGTIVAIGASSNGSNGTSSGKVRVYEYNGNTWTQLGNDMNGQQAQENFGGSVSLSSNGKMIAIGAPGSDSGKGYSAIYRLLGSTWVQLGNNILGDSATEFSGHSVSLSDVSNVAIGSINPFSLGRVRVFSWNGYSWIQSGLDISGENIGDQFGRAVQLSNDGNTIAINSIDGNSFSGSARVYDYNGSSWTKIGNNVDGSSTGFGTSLSLTGDGSKFAVGATNATSGNVQIYELNQNNYTSTINNGSTRVTIPSGGFNILNDGTYRLNATINDIAENHTTIVSDPFVIDITKPIINALLSSGFSWGLYLNASEDDEARTVFISTQGVEDGQTLSGLLNSVTYTADVYDNSAVLTIPATDLENLTNGSQYNFTLNVSDLAGNPADTVTSQNFIVDVSAPVVNVEQGIGNFIFNMNILPEYLNILKFPVILINSNESGKLTSSMTFKKDENGLDVTEIDIVAGSNIIIRFERLPFGTYSNETLTLTDAAENQTTLPIPEFQVTMPDLVIKSR